MTKANAVGRASAHLYYQTHHDEIRAKARAHFWANRDAVNEYNRRKARENYDPQLRHEDWLRQKQNPDIMARRKRYHHEGTNRGKELVLSALLGGCVDCGEKDLRVLELDHVRGTKRKNVSHMYRASEANLLAEIAKCDVRCGNCHRRATGARAGWWANGGKASSARGLAVPA